jgi:hypothetical protein
VRRRRLIATIAAVVALASLITACSGGDDGDGNGSAKPPAADAGRGDGGATPPSADQLPPKFTRCMAERGFPIESPDDIHSAPQQVLQACFGALHEGGGAP